MKVAEWNNVKVGDVLVQKDTKNICWVVVRIPRSAHDRCVSAQGSLRVADNLLNPMHAIPEKGMPSVLYIATNVNDLCTAVATKSQPHIP